MDAHTRNGRGKEADGIIEQLVVTNVKRLALWWRDRHEAKACSVSCMAKSASKAVGACGEGSGKASAAKVILWPCAGPLCAQVAR